MKQDLTNYIKIKLTQKSICSICGTIADLQYTYVLYISQGPGDIIKDKIVMCSSCEKKYGTKEDGWE